MQATARCLRRAVVFPESEMHEQQRVLPGADPVPGIAIDAALVAPRVGLDVDIFRVLADEGCSRAPGEPGKRYLQTLGLPASLPVNGLDRAGEDREAV